MLLQNKVNSRRLSVVSSNVVARSVVRFLDEFGIVRYGQPIPRSGVGDAFPFRAQQASTSASDLMKERSVEFAYLLEDYDEGNAKR